ncbi:MAG: transcription termination/antitermination protein NusG [Lachnospiraceae bacterium]|jgi:transcriptional antiterminator NusG|nr:transcription termination/antitermination protein NusG [Lachnospiraceae bacterium]MEE3460892.1 transcription termination/antitermination protein NusG [Lachnospiraceae bacterium]
MADSEPHWYLAHTYSGYENKVKTDIEQNVANNNLGDRIFEVMVPMIEVTEKAEDGRTVTRQKKMFPAYVLVKMIMNDDTWYIVRNTRGVTGFVGPGSKPVPLSEREIKDILAKSKSDEAGFGIGDKVVVKKGVWEDKVGVVREIKHKERTLTIHIDVFGRETPVEMSFDDVEVI